MAANVVLPLLQEQQQPGAAACAGAGRGGGGGGVTAAAAWVWGRNAMAATLREDEDDSWEARAFAEDASSLTGGTWPPRSYSCTFCRREFRSAQALGGHMNVHRRDRARLRQSPPSDAGRSFAAPAAIPPANYRTGGLCLLYTVPASPLPSLTPPSLVAAPSLISPPPLISPTSLISTPSLTSTPPLVSTQLAASPPDTPSSTPSSHLTALSAPLVSPLSLSHCNASQSLSIPLPSFTAQSSTISSQSLKSTEFSEKNRRNKPPQSMLHIASESPRKKLQTGAFQPYHTIPYKGQDSLSVPSIDQFYENLHNEADLPDGLDLELRLGQKL